MFLPPNETSAECRLLRFIIYRILENMPDCNVLFPRQNFYPPFSFVISVDFAAAVPV